MKLRPASSRHFGRARPRGSPAASSVRPPPSGSRSSPSRSGWRESLPFFVIGLVALTAALALIALQSPSAFGRLPIWTFLLAIGSISLVGGTVASLVGEPMTGLPGENELVGQDLIVVSRSRWDALSQMESWVGGRLGPSDDAARSPTAPGAPFGAVASPAPVPTLDELLADLPIFPESARPDAEQWTETEDSREAPPPAKLPVKPIAPAPRPSVPASPPPSVPPSPTRAAPPAPPRAVPARPRPLPAPIAAKAPLRPLRKGVARPGVRAETAPAAMPNPELERLLADLETEATAVMQEREDVPALIEPGVLTCAHCQRGIGITEKWQNCDECFATYCESCGEQLVKVGDRRLCPVCRHLGRGVRR